MTQAEIFDFLRQHSRMHVATLGRNGKIHLTTVTSGLVGEQIAFWTYRRSQKVLNLERDSRISALVEQGTDYEDLQGVSIEGTAELIYHAPIVREMTTSIFQGLGRLDSAMEKKIVQQSAKRVVVLIRPTRYRSWNHQKLVD